MSVTAQSVVPAGNTLGEGLLWCARAQALYWTDIPAARLWRHRPGDGDLRSWPLPERLASFALCEEPAWLLLGLASRLAFLHLPSGELEPICTVEEGLPTRVNDGACDRDGRFVFGTLHEPEDDATQVPLGGFYRLGTDLRLQRLPLGGVAIANGIAFSPDGRTMYFCDSATRVIRRCRYHADGSIDGVEDWVRLDGEIGEPDGSTVDAAGGVWNAQWGLGRVVRYRPDGQLDTVVTLPARQPTRPALGGAQRRTLYVTSARQGMGPSQDPRSGDLFAARVGHTGLAEPRFGGRPRGSGR